MAKLSKVALKRLIKECLVEILQEGLGFDDIVPPPRFKPTKKRRETVMQMSPEWRDRSRPRKKHPVLKPPALRESVPSLSNRIPKAIASVSSDPTIQALLEDTARTTLADQSRAEHSRGPQAQSDVSLEALDVLGARSNTWEALAFSDAQIDPDSIKLE